MDVIHIKLSDYHFIFNKKFLFIYHLEQIVFFLHILYVKTYKKNLIV